LFITIKKMVFVLKANKLIILITVFIPASYCVILAILYCIYLQRFVGDNSSNGILYNSNIFEETQTQVEN